ncbi:hypothetical protein GIX45_23120 [Erwinia sp. CPCC 100877]|nr:hypothetical protein [Erwinia sp. CPCC 100877]
MIVGDSMFKPKIKISEKEKATVFHLFQEQNSVVIELFRGKNELKLEKINNYFNSQKEDAQYFVDLVFSYKNKLIYTATDESYWCPTCERLIKKHYDSLTNKEIKEMLTNYRETMSSTDSTFKEIIAANDPIIKLLPSGKYTLSLRKIFPTFGERAIFSAVEDGELKSSVDCYFERLEGSNERISIPSLTSYMLPTQTDNYYSEQTLDEYRAMEFLGRGLIIHFSGFLGCLLDGHHKAKIAYERNEPLECLVIEPYIEKVIYKGTHKPVAFYHIPTLSELCHIIDFSEENELLNHDSLNIFIEAIVSGGKLIECNEMAELISTLFVLFPNRLADLYGVITKIYFYKDLKEKYFLSLSLIERSKTIEELMLDFLINDDYENRQVTKICEDYFR